MESVGVVFKRERKHMNWVGENGRADRRRFTGQRMGGGLDSNILYESVIIK